MAKITRLDKMNATTKPSQDKAKNNTEHQLNELPPGTIFSQR